MKTIINKKQGAFRDQRGSALIYILIAIALLGALTISFMEPSSQQTSSQNSFKTVAGVHSQIEMIRSVIQECILRYPGGDNTIDISDSGTDPYAVNPYPIKPNSTHYTGATLGAASNRNVENLRCPGNPGNDQNHVKVFGGSTGKYLPPPPDFFDDWQYYNGRDGVFFWMQTNKSDAFLASALDKLDDNFSECEADVIDATSGAVDMDTAGTAETECPNGYMCFRVWVVANSSASSVHQDADCP